MSRSMHPRAQAVAQAQNQQEAIKSMTESLELVRCLLRVSIFHVAFLRGLFPDNYFKSTRMDNLEGMEIQMLRPQCKDSQRLVDWVERGVQDAIKRMYLQRLYFGISRNAAGTDLLEEYVFHFRYDVNGKVSMKFTAEERKLAGIGSQANVDSVRYQVIRLMRMLIQLCRTLDQVPEERYLFMKLAYTDETPEDYEPPYFQAEGDCEPARFHRRPFSMQVGSIASNFHAVSLGLKSVFDGSNMEEEDKPHSEHQGSAWNPSTTFGGTTVMTEGNEGQADCPMEEVQSDPSILQPEISAQKNKPLEAGVQSIPPVDLVKEYCMHRDEVDFNSTALFFTDVGSKDLSRAFDLLVIDGVLEKTKADNYKVIGAEAQHGKSDKPSPRGQVTAGKETEETQTAKKAKSPGDHENADSVQGRAISHKGSLQSGQPSEMTAARTTKERADGHAALPSEDPTAAMKKQDVYFASQESDGKRWKRKASFVADPIYQKLQPPATRQRSRLRKMCK